jgi:hypothetical protein
LLIDSLSNQCAVRKAKAEINLKRGNLRNATRICSTYRFVLGIRHRVGPQAYSSGKLFRPQRDCKVAMVWRLAGAKSTVNNHFAFAPGVNPCLKQSLICA